MQRASILIVDDEKLIRWSLKDCLESEGHEATATESAKEALDSLARKHFDLVLLDYKLPDTNGLDLLKQIRSLHENLPIIMITAHSSVEHAVEAIHAGATDYVAKPFHNNEIVHRVSSVLERLHLRRVVDKHHEENAQLYQFENVIGSSREMQKVFSLIRRVSDTGDATILIQGESGTGKDVLAKCIHYNSPRAMGPYVNITCTALPETLLESILFGHEKGAFTDARAQKKGLFEEADGGTVFLDEIGDMSLYLQSKLLRFLEERTFRRVGGNEDISVDVRVLAATNRDLKKFVKQEKFREDLYFRLKVIPIHLPPLRERKDDIPQLVDHFIGAFNRELRKNVKSVSPRIMQVLEDYHWPGNVRELKNAIERAMILGSGEMIRMHDLPMDLLDDDDGPGDLDDSAPRLTKKGINLENLEQSLVLQALKLAHGNQTQAGRLLGLNRDQIRYRIEKFHIDLKATVEGEN